MIEWSTNDTFVFFLGQTTVQLYDCRCRCHTLVNKLFSMSQGIYDHIDVFELWGEFF